MHKVNIGEGREETRGMTKARFLKKRGKNFEKSPLLQAFLLGM